MLIFLLITCCVLTTKVNCECQKFDKDHVQQTCPYTNEQLSTLIDSLPSYDENHSCLRDKKCARNWMLRANEVSAKVTERATVLGYQYDTNITDENNRLILELAPLITKLNKNLFITGKRFYNHSNNWEADLKRMFYLTRNVDLSEPEVVEIINNMTAIYAKTNYVKENKTYNLEPEITELFRSSRNYDELLEAWRGWFDNVGPQEKPLFVKSVELQNQYARSYGYADLSEHWIEELEIDEFEKVYDELYEQIKPFYQQLHAYVRRKLREVYGSDKLSSKYIPAHLLGNVWAQSWENIYDIVRPFKEEATFDLTAALKNNDYTPVKLFKESERFFTSIGLYPMTDTFWKYSMIVKPTDGRQVQCHGAAYDFYNGYDYRIKMCTEVTSEYFYIVHHEMGHIEYFMSYATEPAAFRTGANSGFHEAIGDTIALSVNTPTHFKKIGLMKEYNATHEAQLNSLMSVALKKFAFLPFAYLIDKWRWNVFRGKITPDNYNQKWWEMISMYQGIEAPVVRNETYFDAGGKYHVPAYVPYSRYYVATFLQFQFYKGLCKLSDHSGPLHLCDFYGSSKAGAKLKEMLSLGASKHWSKALKILTNSDKMESNAILDYFKPLMQWLTEENSKYPNDPVGW